MDVSPLLIAHVQAAMRVSHKAFACGTLQKFSIIHILELTLHW